ncbi:hypothetical protein [Cohnella abietis]|uniref:Uncharacterized protein n=1 Tax=Cohnella abietis TaxID=2507935 RepID=A0A3T1D2H0_9BACL|nr:hypothetical protein [Cohnella abietis]BBI32306.1 hypothetical protein KCTCHS21_17050 [Cohnella abietis]
MANKEKKAEQWKEAKQLCRLNDEDIRIAKEMGLNPLSLIKNIPAKNQLWKAPVKQWLHEIYEKRKEKSSEKAAVKSTKKLTIGIKSSPVEPANQDNLGG